MLHSFYKKNKNIKLIDILDLLNLEKTYENIDIKINWLYS